MRLCIFHEHLQGTLLSCSYARPTGLPHYPTPLLSLFPLSPLSARSTALPLIGWRLLGGAAGSILPYSLFLVLLVSPSPGHCYSSARTDALPRPDLSSPSASAAAHIASTSLRVAHPAEFDSSSVRVLAMVNSGSL